MSSSTRAPEPGAALPPAAPAAGGPAPWRLAARLRGSLVLRAALANSLVAALVTAMGLWTAGFLLEQDLEDLRPLLLNTGDMLGIPAADLSAWQHSFAERFWRIVAITLGVAALAAGGLAWCTLQLVLAPAYRLAHTANRISARALDERLPSQGHPIELEPVARAFNHMLDRLEDSFSRLSGFSSDVAHDLREPIHRLLIAAEVTLSRPRSAGEYRAAIEASMPVYERMGRLIENILFLARADSQQSALHAAPVPLAQRLQAIAAFFELLAQEQGVQLALQVAPGAVVWADDALLTRATGNLLTNAIRHARKGSTVVVSAEVSPAGAGCISVANEGDPIAPEHQARIFERTYRVGSPSAEAAAGAGLGLAIVKSAMELHGGSATVRSAPGQPTVFTLAFPAPPARHSPPPAAPAPGDPTGG